MKIIWILLGFISLILGTLGIVLPILPTVPFYMATVFCFAKSSDKLHHWFTHTNLYKKREFDSCLQFFTNQIAQNVDYINAFEFFYCQICENNCTNMG